MDQPTHQTGRSSGASRERHQHLPPGTGTFGMVLFLVALTMLFGASMLVYVLIRLGVFGPEQGSPPPLGALTMPWPLWASTGVILLSSYTMHRALDNVRHERQQAFRNALIITLLLGIGFLLVQTPSLTWLVTDHFSQLSSPAGMPLYGLVFFLILVHAAHLLGGLIPLAGITYKAHNARYDHEHYGPVKYITMYWHFLDGVWVVMFAVFLICG